MRRTTHNACTKALLVPSGPHDFRQSRALPAQHVRHCSRYSRVIRIHRNALRIERWINKSHSALSAATVLRNSVFRRRKCLYFCYRDV
jgi:hypothetical protein